MMHEDCFISSNLKHVNVCWFQFIFFYILRSFALILESEISEVIPHFTLTTTWTCRANSKSHFRRRATGLACLYVDSSLDSFAWFASHLRNDLRNRLKTSNSMIEFLWNLSLIYSYIEVSLNEDSLQVALSGIHNCSSVFLAFSAESELYDMLDGLFRNLSSVGYLCNFLYFSWKTITFSMGNTHLLNVTQHSNSTVSRITVVKPD